MKLKPDWLETLSAAARRAPVKIPELLPRTAARVLAHAREQRAPWWDYLALRAAIAGVAMAVLMLTASLAWPGRAQAREVRAAAELEILLSLP